MVLYFPRLDTVFAEFHKLVRDLPLRGPNDPQQGPLIEVPGTLARYWEWRWQHPASSWRSFAFETPSAFHGVD